MEISQALFFLLQFGFSLLLQSFFFSHDSVMVNLNDNFFSYPKKKKNCNIILKVGTAS